MNTTPLAVAITNRWIGNPIDADRSRGLLVRDLLDCTDLDEALRTVQHELNERRYAGFNLLLGDLDETVVIEWDGRLHQTRLDPGVHVVTNVGIDDTYQCPSNRESAAQDQAATAQRIRRHLDPPSTHSAAEWLDAAATVLGDHEFDVCVHDDGFGTRSSSLMAMYPSRPLLYRFADGPPCRTEYHTLTPPER